MKKNQIIILIVVIVLIFGGIIVWTLIQKEKLPLEEEIGWEREAEEIFGLSGVVSSVDAENNFLMVRPLDQDNEIKVVILDATRLIRLEIPPDTPREADFIFTETEIEIFEFKEGDNVFIQAHENIAGKSVIDNVDFIHLLP